MQTTKRKDACVKQFCDPDLKVRVVAPTDCCHMSIVWHLLWRHFPQTS